MQPVGILEVEQKSEGKKERNDRVFAMPDRSPLGTDLQSVELFQLLACPGRPVSLAR
jgi:hypothetical protein